MKLCFVKLFEYIFHLLDFKIFNVYGLWTDPERFLYGALTTLAFRTPVLFFQLPEGPVPNFSVWKIRIH